MIIDNKQIEVKEGTSILEAAKQNGINIPTLCYLKDLNEIGACRVCVVEVKGVEKEINNNDEEINKKKEEIENIKKENNEKVEILETWKKEIKKVKKDS